MSMLRRYENTTPAGGSSMDRDFYTSEHYQWLPFNTKEPLSIVLLVLWIGFIALFFVIFYKIAAASAVSEYAVEHEKSVWFTALFCYAGILAPFQAHYFFLQNSRAETWPITTGVITVSEMSNTKEHNFNKWFAALGSKRWTYYTPFIEYEYTVNGIGCKSDVLGFVDQASPYSADISRILEKYPLGKSVPVYYNPENPTEAVLDKQPDMPYWLFSAMGGVFFVFGLFVFFETRPPEIIITNFSPVIRTDSRNPSISSPFPDTSSQAESTQSGAHLSAYKIFGVVKTGNMDEIRRVFETGADVNTEDRQWGETPLMLAASMGSESIVRYLIRMGANVNARTRAEGWTALDWAADRGHIGVAAILADHRANGDAADRKFGENALFLAVAHGHIDVARLLIEQGVRMNMWANSTTLLNQTVKNYYSDRSTWDRNKSLEDVLRFLFEHGADPSNEDRNKITALDCALKFKAEDRILSMLRKKAEK